MVIDIHRSQATLVDRSNLIHLVTSNESTIPTKIFYNIKVFFITIRVFLGLSLHRKFDGKSKDNVTINNSKKTKQYYELNLPPKFNKLALMLKWHKR